MTTSTIDPNEKPRYVREMFGRIARRYDLMNMLMTGGWDRHWRKLAVEAAHGQKLDESTWQQGIGLDIASGTGDLAIALAHQAGLARVVAVDLTPEMLQVAHQKVQRMLCPTEGTKPLLGLMPENDRQQASRLLSIDLAVADGLHLPFPDDTFVCITIGFGVRNFADLPLAFAEMRRVLKPGGRVVCLELSRSPNPIFNRFFDLYFDHIVPIIGRLVAGDSAAYTYLPSSVKAFPPADELATIMRAAGLDAVRFRRLGLGTVALHVGVK
jgi:demethylmenaquinone methyltransferase/2-methoxy-6-polyprenyl-1,4-benzoquinol methylase